MNVKCPVCGNNMVVREDSKNVMVVDGVIMHRKCPKPKMSKEDSHDYNLLREKIKFYINTKPNPKMTKFGYNWTNIAVKIKQLKEQGYSYSDMLYSLDETVKMQGCFFGFGAVVNNIEPIMYRKKQYESIDEVKKVEVGKIDLKILEDDMDW